MRTIAEQCARAMRAYPTPLHDGSRIAQTLYDDGYYQRLAKEFGSEAAAAFAEWLEMHGVQVDTPETHEPVTTLAAPLITPELHPPRSIVHAIFNWLRNVDLNKYDVKKTFRSTLIIEETTTITVLSRPKPATKTRHGAKPTRHENDSTRHGAKPTRHENDSTRHELSGISYEQLDHLLELIQQNSQ